MIVFNTINKIGRRFVSELEGLYLRVLEKSKVNIDTRLEVTLKDKGRYNTVAKLRRRKAFELQHLKAGVVQLSYREHNSTIDMLNSNVDTTNYNSFKRVSRRAYGELNKLYVWIVENSYRAKQTTISGIKTIKPNKTYIQNIKLIKKYDNKIKY